MALAIRSTATSLFGLLFSLVISLSGQEEGPDLRFLEVAEGLERPVDIQDPQDGSNRLFIVEQAGRIQIIKDGAVLSAPFLDIADRVRDVFNEEGLLGLAFSPNFPADGIFYVNYTNGATSNSRRTRTTRTGPIRIRKTSYLRKASLSQTTMPGNCNLGRMDSCI